MPYKEREDMRERFVQQKQKVNEGFWGTLQANTMHKDTYMQLLNSKDARGHGGVNYKGSAAPNSLQ